MTSPTDKEEHPKINEENRAVKFNDSVRVKTIEARKNTFRERLDLFKRLHMGGITLGENEEDGEDDEFSGEDDVDWDMERFADIDSDVESMSVDDMDEDDGEEDPDATGSDPDLYSDADVGVETIQRLKNDLFDDELPESQDPGAFSPLTIPHLVLPLQRISSMI